MEIKKYQKTPVIVEAVQWPGYLSQEIQAFTDGYIISEQREGIGASTSLLVTPDGNMMLSNKDYIIKMDNKFYRCRPDVFKASYQEIMTIDTERGNS